MKNFFEFGADGAFAGRISATLDVGGILKEREHAFFTVFGKSVKVKKLIISWCGVDFKISGVDDNADGRMNGQRDAIDDAVRHPYRIDGEGTDAEAFGRLDLNEISVIEEPVFFQFVFDKSKRELGAINGDVEFA